MDYSNLRGEIRKKFPRQADFATALGMSPASLSAKLNGKTEWQGDEIAKACDILGIPYADAHEYFFCPKC